MIFPTVVMRLNGISPTVPFSSHSELIYLRLRPEDQKAVAALCAYGIREDGKKVLLHLAVGDKESTVCWKSFFQDLKQRGFVEPLLVILDGNSGLRRAVRECFPESWVQRCQVHRMRNILCKLPEDQEADPESIHGSEPQNGSGASPSGCGDV